MENTVELLTKAEAAKMARITAGTIDKLIKAGTGPIPTRIGGRVFIAESDMSAWIASNRGQPASVRTPQAAGE
jgi:predicted DNA-binding transcriptional regulator AlpA